MIDPRVLEFDDPEEFLLFAIVVAGKRATVQAQKLDALLSTVEPPMSALHKAAILEGHGVLEQNLRAAGIGQYTRILAAIRHLIHRRPRLDLATCTTDELEETPGIGPKTSRFFILHSRPGARVACLDTHILRWMRDMGWPAPMHTPPAGPHYRRLEEWFLRFCDLLKADPAAVDLAIWNYYSKDGTPERIVVFLPPGIMSPEDLKRVLGIPEALPENSS